MFVCTKQYKVTLYTESGKDKEKETKDKEEAK